jgi:hypothetical protein
MVFSRPKLLTYLTCQRRFQLRYLRQLPWPAAPQKEKWRVATRRGQAFHRLLERYFLGLPVDPGRDGQLKRWWESFQESGPDLPAGLRLPEINVTVPVGNHLLTGRFDLLVLNGPAGHIFDWKTEQNPRSAADLAADWQTRLYLAILVEGGAALQPGGKALDPDLVKLTYWFVHAPQAAVTLAYSRAEHAANWAEIKMLAAEIGNKPAEDKAWPLTTDWSHCGRCAYQVFCGRQAAPAGEMEDDWAEEEAPLHLEPDYI